MQLILLKALWTSIAKYNQIIFAILCTKARQVKASGGSHGEKDLQNREYTTWRGWAQTIIKDSGASSVPVNVLSVVSEPRINAFEWNGVWIKFRKFKGKPERVYNKSPTCKHSRREFLYIRTCLQDMNFQTSVTTLHFLHWKVQQVAPMKTHWGRSKKPEFDHQRD